MDGEIGGQEGCSKGFGHLRHVLVICTKRFRIGKGERVIERVSKETR